VGQFYYGANNSKDLMNYCLELEEAAEHREQNGIKIKNVGLS
jgi:hypothetical protein